MKFCNRCQRNLSDASFNKKGNGLSGYCKECNREYLREHYSDNKEYYMEKSKVFKTNRRKEFFEWLDTKSCVDCGISDIRVLEFDHVRGKKLGTIASMISDSSFKKLWEEVDKCDIVCANCHRIRTAGQFSYYDYLVHKHLDGV